MGRLARPMSRPAQTQVHTRILILTVHHGASHERVAKALRSALLEAAPGVTVVIADALAHTPAWFRFYYDSYLIPLRLVPALWARIEKAQRTHQSSGPCWLYRRAARSLFGFISDFDPALVVATEVGICELVAMMKREMGARFELAGIPTGLDADRPWAQPEVGLYVVAGDEAARELEAAGVRSDRIRATGQPVDPAFSATPDGAETRRQLGIEPDLPLLLVLFGGMGSGRPEVIVEGLRDLHERVEIVFITGRNGKLEACMRKLAEGRPGWRVLGWVDNMHEWMTAADLALSKPGASTLIEALDSGLPLLAFDPLPGNERRASDWIEKHGVGVWIRDAREIAPAVSRLLRNPGELERLRKNALTHARPRAAYDAAAAILGLLS
jgi:processive 1,2-diacylglycerol beta-glucosyltransferase